MRHVVKLAEVITLQMESHLIYSRKGLGWEICIQHRLYRKDSTLLINNRLSLQPLWHTAGCIGGYQSVFWLSHALFFPLWAVQKISETVCLVLWDLLFMLVSWWCKSEKPRDVLLKHAYVCGERLSLHSGGCSRDQCASTLSPSTAAWQRAEMLGLSDCLSLSLAWLWGQGRPAKGGRRQRRKRPARDWQPSCHTQCHCHVY